MSGGVDQAAFMRTQSTTSGSELLLGVIAIRLAMLVFAGWSLSLLPRQDYDRDIACFPSPATTIEAQPPKMAASRVANATFDDMRLHD